MENNLKSFLTRSSERTQTERPSLEGAALLAVPGLFVGTGLLLDAEPLALG